MKKEISAGLVMWDVINGVPKILLCHPGGPYFYHKDFKSWGIPKGAVETDEKVLDAAIREFEEETGISVKNQLHPLEKVIYKSGKTVHAYAFRGKFPGTIKSNFFNLEWPPHSGTIQQFPENDRGAMFTIEEAMEKVMVSQEPFVMQMKNFFIDKGLI